MMSFIAEKHAINYNDLISQCEFDRYNPYDLTVNIIDNYLPIGLQKIFIEQAFKNWTFVLFRGDTLSPMIYQAVFDSIKNNKYKQFKNLTTAQKLQIDNFFTKTIAEEIQHLDAATFLVKKCSYNFGNLQYPEENLLNDICPTQIIRNLFKYYVIESQGQTMLSMIHKYSSNKAKRKFIKPLLQEESQHTNGFYKIIKMLKNTVTDNDLELVHDYITMKHDKTFRYEYFGFYELHNFFSFCERALKNKIEVNIDFKKDFLSAIKKNKFQQEYHTLVSKKVFKCYNLLFPHVTEKEFRMMLENNINTYVEKEIEKL